MQTCVTSQVAALRTYEDVAAAVELAVDVDLREGGPLAVFLHAAAQPIILQDVDRRERRLQVIEYLQGRRAIRTSTFSRVCRPQDARRVES